MKNKKVLYASIFMGLVIIGVGFYGYAEFNRKNENLSDTDALYTLAASDLIGQFSSDEPGSNTKYLSKVVEVSGQIKKVDEDVNGFYTLVLGDSATTSSVRCSLDSSLNKQTISYTTGQVIAIKGICTGYTADDLGLGADVMLNRCIPVKQ